jgi:SWI/SNF chromatin-remodeling complex subunit SWI1
MMNNHWPNGQANGMFMPNAPTHLNPAMFSNNNNNSTGNNSNNTNSNGDGIGNSNNTNSLHPHQLNLNQNFDVNGYGMSNNGGAAGIVSNPTPPQGQPFQQPSFNPASVVPAKRPHDGMSGSPTQGQPQQLPPGSRAQTPSSYNQFQGGQQPNMGQFANAPTPYQHLQQPGSNNATPSPTMQSQPFRPPGQQPQQQQSQPQPQQQQQQQQGQQPRINTASPSPFPQQQMNYGNQMSPLPPTPTQQNMMQQQQGQMGAFPQQGYGMAGPGMSAQAMQSMQMRMPNAAANMTPEQRAYQMQLMQKQQQMRNSGMMPSRNVAAPQSGPMGQFPGQQPAPSQAANGVPGNQTALTPQQQQHRQMHDQKRRQFLQALTQMAQQQGRQFNPLPNIGGKQVDLYALWSAVVSTGGSQKIEAGRQWPMMAMRLGFNQAQYPTAGDELKQLYMTGIYTYEQLWFQSKRVQDPARQNQQQVPGGAAPALQQGQQQQPQQPQQQPQQSPIKTTATATGNQPFQQYPPSQQNQLPHPQSTPVQSNASLAVNGLTTPRQMMTGPGSLQHRRGSSLKKTDQLTPQPELHPNSAAIAAATAAAANSPLVNKQQQQQQHFQQRQQQQQQQQQQQPSQPQHMQQFQQQQYPPQQQQSQHLQRPPSVKRESLPGDNASGVVMGGPLMKSEELPLSTNYLPQSHHLLNPTNPSYGGYDIPALDAVASTIVRATPPSPAVEDLAYVDIRGLTMGLASGIHTEVRYALDALAVLSNDQRIALNLDGCEELLDALVDCGEGELEILLQAFSTSPTSGDVGTVDGDGKNEEKVTGEQTLSHDRSSSLASESLPSYEALLRGSKLESFSLLPTSTSAKGTFASTPSLGTADYTLDRAAEKIIAITTILRNFSFYEVNHRLLTDEAVVSWFAKVIEGISLRRKSGEEDAPLFLRSFFNTQDFYKDAIIFLSNVTQSLELPNKDVARKILLFLLAFAPEYSADGHDVEHVSGGRESSMFSEILKSLQSPGSHSNGTDKNNSETDSPMSRPRKSLVFPSFNPSVHRYLPPAVDCLAKLLARQEPNRELYRQIFHFNTSSAYQRPTNQQHPLDLLTRSFALAVSVLPDRTQNSSASAAAAAAAISDADAGSIGSIAPSNIQQRIVEARKAYLAQGMLAADILSSLAPAPSSNASSSTTGANNMATSSNGGAVADGNGSSSSAGNGSNDTVPVNIGRELARAWLQSEDGWAVGLVKLAGLLSMTESLAPTLPTPAPAKGRGAAANLGGPDGSGAAAAMNIDPESSKLITFRALSMLKRLVGRAGTSEKSGSSSSSTTSTTKLSPTMANGPLAAALVSTKSEIDDLPASSPTFPTSTSSTARTAPSAFVRPKWEGMPFAHAILGAVTQPQVDKVALGLLCDLHEIVLA